MNEKRIYDRAYSPLCPSCGIGRPGVTETRLSARGLRRRRQCRTCKFRWTTIEVAVVEAEKLPRCLAAPNSLRMLEVAS